MRARLLKRALVCCAVALAIAGICAPGGRHLQTAALKRPAPIPFILDVKKPQPKAVKKAPKPAPRKAPSQPPGSAL